MDTAVERVAAFERNRSLRRVIKTKSVFPREEAVLRQMYLTMNNIAK